MVREGRVLISVATDPDFGSSYYVTAYEVGAQVTSGSAGNTVAVRAGHGFAAADKFIVGTSTAQYKVVLSVTSTQLTLSVGTTVTVSAGDLLVNPGQDTGTSTPSYVQSVAGLTVYTDMDYSTVATNNTVQTDANGKYRYYHKGINTWELVRSSLTVPIALYTDAGISETTGPDTSTDNAVARWDGATGEALQNSVVTIGDTGAVAGVTTLAMAGALSGVTTLAASGTATMAAINASGTVAAAGAMTVGTTLNVTGTLTAAGDASVGAGGLGSLTVGVNITAGAGLRGGVTTRTLTASSDISTINEWLIDITVTSGACTACTLTVLNNPGQILILRIVSLGSGSISFIEGTTAVLAGNTWATPTAGSTLTLINTGSIWYELSRSAG